VHFDQAAARAMGRASRGVRGMRLREDDQVVGLIVVPAQLDRKAFTVVTACAKGYGKRTIVEDYPIKGRGGQGVINIKVTERNGPVIAMRLAREGDDLMFLSQGGMIVRTPVAEMRPMGRNTQGVRLVNLKSDDLLVGMEVVTEEDLELAAKTAVESGAALRPPLIVEPIDGEEEDDEPEASDEDELDEGDEAEEEPEETPEEDEG
jgi:DNA gyrase subunit A